MKISEKIAIADSSALFSLIKTQDSNYHKALAIAQKLVKQDYTIIIPGDVFSEMLNVVGKKLGREAQLTAAEKLSSDAFSIVESDPDMRMNSIGILKKLPSSVSYTDCVVMAFADYYETKEIFGFDEIFTKSGYKLPGS